MMAEYTEKTRENSDAVNMKYKASFLLSCFAKNATIAPNIIVNIPSWNGVLKFAMIFTTTAKANKTIAE